MVLITEPFILIIFPPLTYKLQMMINWQIFYLEGKTI